MSPSTCGPWAKSGRLIRGVTPGLVICVFELFWGCCCLGLSLRAWVAELLGGRAVQSKEMIRRPCTDFLSCFYGGTRSSLDMLHVQPSTHRFVIPLSLLYLPFGALLLVFLFGSQLPWSVLEGLLPRRNPEALNPENL